MQGVTGALRFSWPDVLRIIRGQEDHSAGDELRASAPAIAITPAVRFLRPSPHISGNLEMSTVLKLST